MKFASTARAVWAAGLCAFLSAPGDTAAQAFEPLTHRGELSRDFTDRASRRAEARTKATRTKAKRAKESGSRRAQRREQRRREAFNLETAFALNRYHRSGQILSGDWVSEMVGRVGEKVAAALPAAGRGAPIRFYVIASPAVNAFATPDRTVYVTMGLLARLESEAQLAFVLAHELGHVDGDHSLTLFLEKEAYNDQQRKLSRRKRDDDPFATNRYSRAKEEEADDFGFGLYRGLGYSGDAGLSAFRLLGDSYLTFGEYRLDPAELGVLGVGVDEAWLLDSLVAAETSELTDEEIEERSTHPALSTRYEKAREQLGDLPGEAFQLWTPEELTRLRRQARYETVDYQLRDFDNLAAMQNAMGLLDTEVAPDTVFLLRTALQAGLNQAVVRGIYDDVRAELRRGVREARGKYRKELARDRLEDLDDYPDAGDAYGEAQRFYHLYAEADPEDLGVILLARAVDLERRAPELASARVLTDRTLELLAANGVTSVSKLRERAAEAVAAADAAGLDLEGRLRTARRYADLEEYNREDVRRLSADGKKSAALGYSRVLVVPPRYREGLIKANYAYEEDLLGTEAGEAEQAKLIEATMRATGLRGEVLSDGLGKGDAETLARVREAKSWIGQFKGLESLRLIPHNHDRLLALTEAADAEAIVSLSEVESGINGFGRGAMVYLDLVYALVNPVDAVASLASKREIRGQEKLVIDPEARRIVHSQPIAIRMSRQPDVYQKAVYYEFFDQLTTKPKRR